MFEDGNKKDTQPNSNNNRLSITFFYDRKF